MLDSALFVTLFVILGTALFGAIIAARVRDPCLKQWHGYPVHLVLLPGDRAAGRLHSEASGLEIAFSDAQAGPNGTPRHSFILYRDEYASIAKVIRFLDELSSDELRRRERALRHAYRPAIHRRWARRMRNWLNTLKDAFSDAAAAVAGHAGLKGQSGRAGSTGGVLAGSLGRAHDALLERHIGHRVVAVVEDGDGEEYVGVFREYSSVFLSIADVESPSDSGEPRTADLILSRPRWVVRAAAEPI